MTSSQKDQASDFIVRSEWIHIGLLTKLQNTGEVFKLQKSFQKICYSPVKTEGIFDMKLFTVFTGTPLTSSCIFSTICSICSKINHTSTVTCSCRTYCVSNVKSTISSSNSTLTKNLKFLQSESVLCAYHSLQRAVKFYSNWDMYTACCWE